MSIIDDLKKQIRKLEQEQARQHFDLKDLQSLYDLAEVSALEQELQKMAQNAQLQEKQQKVEDIKLEAEKILIRQGDREAIRQRNQQPHGMVADVDLSLEHELAEMNKKPEQKSGFRICLLFETPSEWSDESGGGWRGVNQGTVYDNLAQAQTQAQVLKQRWPDYPIKIKQY